MSNNTFATTGTLIYIGPQVSGSSDPATYEGLSASFVSINPVESIGKFGDSSANVDFTSLTDSRVRKNKGARDAGDITLVCAWDAEDAGQVALIAGEKTNKKYAFKIVLPDAPTDVGTNTAIYFRALVSTDPYNIGTANDTIKREYTLRLDSALTEVPATG